MPAPNSYKDAFWSDLSTKVEQKVGLPSGLLSSIVNFGERSNSDQVSEAGAKTVFQIIPATRDAVLKKYGIDAYLSPENAAEAAGLLLKESLDRNKGDVSQAVGEYHGGTNRSNWGPRTRAYIDRVSTGLQGKQDDSLLADISSWKQSQSAPAKQAQPAEDDILAAARQWKAGRPAQQERGFLGDVAEAITGRERTTQATQELPDWATMPELNSFSLASAKTGLGTLLSNPKETVQVIQSNFPGVQVRQDEKGNFLLTSSIDGREYAIKPGFAVSDIPRAAGAVAAFTPAGRAGTIGGAALKSAATQAAIETSQGATGGEFDPAEVAIAGAVGGAVPAVARVVGAAADPVRRVIGRATGAVEPPPVAAAVPEAAPSFGGGQQWESNALRVTAPPASAAPASRSVVAERSFLPADDLAQTARTAAEGGMGSSRARQVLAEQAAPDAKVTEAAQRLGIEDYLQPDHVTTNQAFRELSQAAKSIPGSEARAAEVQGLEQVAQRASNLIDEIGGTTDLSRLNEGVRRNLQATQSELEARANRLYDDIRQAVPADTKAPARNVVAFVEQRAKDLGGKENLSPMEKGILARLAPKALKKDGAATGWNQQPTYTLLDDVRKDLGAAARNAGPFKDADTGLAKKLYSLLSDDQAAVIERLGMSDTYNAARQAVAVRKGLEDDLVSLFGKNLDSSFIGDLSGSVRSLAQGDAEKLVRLIQTVPEDMRQQVVASGLQAAFKTAGTRGPINFGTYAKWYEGLLKNKRAHAALMSNLPPSARKQLSDLYRVSDAISKATRERITTGRIQAVVDELRPADTFAGRVYEMARKAAPAAMAEAATTSVGLPGVGIASGVASALTRGAKPEAIKAVDALITSPEFVQMAKSAGTPGQKQAALRLAYSRPMTRFARSLGNPREMRDRERWVLQAMQAKNNSQER